MNKYDKMLEQNRKASKEKVSCAIASIINVLQQEEKITISELTKKQDYQEIFFIKIQKYEEN